MLKKLLVPHHHNLYFPLLLRRPALAYVAVCIILVQAVFNHHVAGSPEVLGYATDISARHVVGAVNAERSASGGAVLAVDDRLTRAAQAKADDMVSRDYWSHHTPDGQPPWVFIRDQDYTYSHAGENLARDFATSTGVVAGWMASPGHRDNVLNGHYTEIGVAQADGRIDGEETTVVVALFAAPQDAPSAVIGAAGDVLGQGVTAAPPQLTFSLARPLALDASLNWALKLTVPLLGLLTLMFTTQHLIIRHRHLYWNPSRHAHPALQAALLLGAIVVLVNSSYGVVG